MRYIDRGAVERPAFLDSEAFREVAAAIEREQLSSEIGKRGLQYTLSFRERMEPFLEEAMAALGALFQDKCAYTERPARGKEPLRLHLHRPGGDALGLDSAPSPEHYWWRQTDWDNWMLIAPETETVKGTNFPVLGPRASRDGNGEERALLIDPTAEQPALWLAFARDGGVRPRRFRDERFGEIDRAAVNIRILDLGSEALVAERGEYIRSHRAGLDGALEMRAPAASLLGWTRDHAEDWLPYQGALRQETARVFLQALLRLDPLPGEQDEATAELIALLAPEIGAELAEQALDAEELRQRLGRVRYEALFEPAIAPLLDLFPALAEPLLGAGPLESGAPPTDPATDPPPETPPDRGVGPGAPAPSPLPDPDPEPPPDDEPRREPQHIGRAARLRRIVIRNFKAIERLELEIPEGAVRVATGPLRDRRERDDAVSWKMLLGENASGKSTVLQAVALALHGPELARGAEANVPPPVPLAKARRRGSEGQEAFITLEFRGHEPVTLRLDEDAYRYERDPDYALFVRGYGATRLIRRDLAPFDPAMAAERRRVGNLFDPFVPVVDADAWLLSLDEGDFNVAARAILQLIAGFDPQGPVADREQAGLALVRDRDAGRVMLGEDPLDELSDGYQSLLALACDIMAGIGGGLSDMENGVGIVLLDEIGAHLHPRLRMQIVSRLRFTFPSIQFLASTHEPLCLRGLVEDEVDRIWRVGGRVSRQTIARSPSSFRVDQLLTSEYFGLDSTIDPEVDGEFQEYYHLLARDELSAEEDARRRELRAKLITEGVLGYTRRDQLVYEAIDAYLADERSGSEDPAGAAAAERKGEVFERIRQVWAMAELESLGREADDDRG